VLGSSIGVCAFDSGRAEDWTRLVARAAGKTPSRNFEWPDEGELELDGRGF